MPISHQTNIAPVELTVPSAPIKHELQQIYTNLKQWKAFHAVVSSGTFAAAAEILNVSQPSVSYTISQLEEQLGISLLKPKGRKAEITESGKLLLEHSRRLLQQANELEALAKHLRNATQTEIRLLMNRHFSTSVLMDAIRLYKREVPRTNIKLIVGRESSIKKQLFEEACDLAISTEIPADCYGRLLCQVKFVAVAHTSHKLFTLGRNVTKADLESELQVIMDNEVVDFSSSTDMTHLSSYIQHAYDHVMAQKVLSEGLGYGWFAENQAQAMCCNSDLRAIPLEDRAELKCDLYIVHGQPLKRKSDMSRLADLLCYAAADSAPKQVSPPPCLHIFDTL